MRNSNLLGDHKPLYVMFPSHYKWAGRNISDHICYVPFTLYKVWKEHHLMRNVPFTL